jgi:hypothetical protein
MDILNQLLISQTNTPTGSIFDQSEQQETFKALTFQVFQSNAFLANLAMN